MDQHTKARFAQVLFRNDADLSLRGKPDAVPANILKMADECEESNRWFCTKSQIDLDQLWLIPKLADIYEKLNLLTDRLQDAEAKLAEEPEDKPKIDLRTKEGRALRAATIGA